jgi:hypothetical protein
LQTNISSYEFYAISHLVRHETFRTSPERTKRELSFDINAKRRENENNTKRQVNLKILKTNLEI